MPANPVDFNLTASDLLTLNGSATTPAASYPYTGGSSIFPYTYNNGQLTLSLNSAQQLGISQGTAMVNTSGAFYVLDNEPPNPNPTGAISQILPYTVGTNGALQPETSGIIPDDTRLSNPIYLILESKSKFLYVANQGNNIVGNNTESGIAGYFVTTSPAYQATFIAGQPFSTGSGPQCIVEYPSNQFFYTANFNDSTITGHTIDVNSGVLDNLRNTNNYSLPGPATAGVWWMDAPASKSESGWIAGTGRLQAAPVSGSLQISKELSRIPGAALQCARWFDFKSVFLRPGFWPVDERCA